MTQGTGQHEQRQGQRARRFAVIAVAAAAAALLTAAPAQAYPQGYWACYGTAIHADGDGPDPVIANPYAVPCQEDSQSMAATGQLNGSAGSVAATDARASTNGVLNDPPATGDAGTAAAGAGEATIVSGGTIIRVQDVESSASATCEGSSFVLRSSSRVGRVSINGVEYPVSGQAQDIPIPTVGTLRLNTDYKPVDFAVYRRAVWLETQRGNVIVGEAAVAGVKEPCVDGPPPPPPTPPTPGFGCYASAYQIGISQPFVANRFIGPCATERASVADFSAVNNIIEANTLYAQTTAKPNPLPVYSSLSPYPAGTTAKGEAGGKRLVVGLDALPVTVDSFVSRTSATCTTDGKLRLSSTGQVHGLKIAGMPVADSTEPTAVPLPGGGVVHLNWIFQNSVYVQRRALWIQTFLGQDIVLGDSLAGANTSPC